MTEKKDPRLTSDADQGPERVDARSGLDRLKRAMLIILEYPKAHRDNDLRTQKTDTT